jgi:beta-glucosidase
MSPFFRRGQPPRLVKSCRSLAAAVSVAITVAGLAVVSAPADAAPPALTGTARVDWLISQMTLTEKVNMIDGAAEAASTNQYQAGYLPGVPRLGIPSLRLADGPPGVATKHASVGMTQTMGVAATFSTRDARENGVVIGRDARALGQDVTLQPFVNMDRDPTWSRAFNVFGEDPYLTGQTGAAEIAGIQSWGTLAQVKHFIAYDGANNVVVDEQTLHEIYLAPFTDAVKAGSRARRSTTSPRNRWPPTSGWSSGPRRTPRRC